MLPPFLLYSLLTFADKVIEFVKSDSPLAGKVNADYVIMKETEKKKYLPKQVVEIVQNAGYEKFNFHQREARPGKCRTRDCRRSPTRDRGR